jgi:hypothetical protein
MAADATWPSGVPLGAATGVGSMPGLDLAASQARILEILPGLPHLIELPARGPGADLIGRTAALLTGLSVDLQPAGWRLVSRPGRDLRRAQDLLSADLDTLAEVADGWTGPLKLQAAGPWTLAATLELARGDKALADPAAVADIAASLADGLAAHVAHVHSLVPAATLIMQLDEPALPAVLAGHVPTASGFSVLPTPDQPELVARLAEVLAAVPFPGVHCCAPRVPVGLIRSAGARWVSVDLTLRQDEDSLGEALEGGTGLVLGVDRVSSARDLARRFALPPRTWTVGVVLSPRCGLAGESPEGALARLTALATEAGRFAEDVLA